MAAPKRVVAPDFDRDGLAGPWMLLKQSGLVLSSADGKRAACNISTTDAETVMVSNDGHRVLVTRRYRPMRSLSHLETGLVLSEGELDPSPCLPSWHLFRVSTGTISASAADGLSLCVPWADQEYYKDGSKTVAKVVGEQGAAVKRFTRFEVGVV